MLWGALPIVSLLIYRSISPIWTLALSTVIGTVFLGVLFFWRRLYRELRDKKSWQPILLSALIIGVLYYLIFFFGLQFTTAGNASIIINMEIWFAFLFFGLILKKEKYTFSALLGAVLMFGGVLLILFPGTLEFNKGNLLIFFATMLPPIGNYFQQLARKRVSAVTLLFLRSLIAAAFLLPFAFLLEGSSKLDLQAAALPLLFNGVVLFGLSKILWIEGIHIIPVAKAATINTLIPVFALAYAYIILGEVPSIYQFVGLIPILFGAILIARKKFLRYSPA